MVKLQESKQEQNGYITRHFHIGIPMSIIRAMNWEKGDDINILIRDANTLTLFKKNETV